jgi:hypothetical protein
VNFSGGGSSPQVIPITIDTFSPVTISSAGINTAPPVNTLYTVTTGTQTDRVFRDGVGSSCSQPKTFPGSISAGSPRYNAYTFTAQNSGCITVSFSTPGGTGATQLFATAYIGAFNPANIGTNYAADIGFSPNNETLSFAFNVTAGQQFTIVVAEVAAGGASNVAYTLNVTGPPTDACTFVTTAATVSVEGRVTTRSGNGIHKATVTITDSSGNSVVTQTNGRGYYKFNGVTVGQSYILTATAKGYQFAPQVVRVIDSVSDVNFVAQ